MVAELSRRSVLIAVGGLVAAGAGLAALGLRRPQAALVRTACGEGEGMPKVLVAYATRAGSTAEVAGRVAQRLCAQDLSAEARPVEEVADLSSFATVVLGSGTYYASKLPEMTRFAQDHAAELGQCRWPSSRCTC